MLDKHQTVESLRKNGWKVMVRHRRLDESGQLRPLNSFGKGELMDCKGGATQVYITNPAGDMTSVGESFCSDKDAFRYKAGVRIAMQRAIYNFNNKLFVLDDVAKLVGSVGSNEMAVQEAV